jgi:hypothetical protein
MESKTIMDKTCTLTICDRSENHIGMEQMGNIANIGFSLEKLREVQEVLGGDIFPLICAEETEEDGYVEYDVEPAYILIIRKGVEKLVSLDDIKAEQFSLEPDTRYWDTRRKKVLNKHARGNLCFSKEGHPADYENKQGTVIAYDDVHHTNILKCKIEEIFGEESLECEGNYYYDITKTGIGFHGDAERRKVIGIRLGATLPLHYQWFYKSNPIGDRIKFELNDGDIYVMSDKAVGFDWKKKNVPTLRHAAGCKKYLEIKK